MLLVKRVAPVLRSRNLAGAVGSNQLRRFQSSVLTRAAMEKVSFGTGSLPGYITGPKGAPGLIVLQEWWGVNDSIKQHATLLSKMGYRCLVPDLYKGKLGLDAEEAHHLMSSLDFKAAIGELTQAVTWLRDDQGCAKVGVVGFCMGGALTFCAAQHSGVDAAAPFYGTPDPAVCTPSSIKVPVQGHFGELDAMKGFSDPQRAGEVVEAMRGAGCEAELFLYPECGHGFMNVLTEEGQALIQKMHFPTSKEQAEVALGRLREFFGKHLGAAA